MLVAERMKKQGVTGAMHDIDVLTGQSRQATDLHLN